MTEFPTTSFLLNAILKEEPPKAPFRATIDLTTNCNLRCEFCWFHAPANKKQPPKEHASTVRVKTIIKELADIGTKAIYLSGEGDPISHPGFPQIVDSIKDAGMYLTVNTNLAVDSSNFRQAYTRIDHLMVNLAATDEASYQLIHAPRSQNAFGQACRNLQYISKFSRLTGHPYIEISHVLTKHNFRNIKHSIDTLRSFGAASIWFKTLQPTPFSKHLVLNKKDRKELLHILSATLQQPIGIKTNLLEMIQILRQPPRKTVPSKHCFIGWFNIKIRQNGDVGLCCLNHKLKIGNCRHDPIHKIWNSPATHRLRMRVQNHINIKQLNEIECRYCPYTSINEQLEKALQQHGYFSK